MKGVLICKQITQTVTITLSGLELKPLLPSLCCLGRLPPLALRVETLSLSLGICPARVKSERQLEDLLQNTAVFM